MYRFSIIIPCYNKAKYIGQAVQSILLQETSPVEIILVDGGSNDGSLQSAQTVLASELAAHRKAQGWAFHCICEPDLGQAHAINKGLLLAKGEYVAWLNADDFYREQAFIRVDSEFNAAPKVGMLYGGLDFVDEAGSLIRTRPQRRWDRKQLLDSYCYVPQPSTFWRRDLLAIAGILDTSLYYTMDYEYWLRLSQYAEVGSLSKTLAAIRIMEGTKTGTSPLNAMPEALVVGRKYGARYFSKFRFAYWMWRMGAEGLVRAVGRRINW
jgi:glycosyltransferase involved in cell wall biosynthesis